MSAPFLICSLPRSRSAWLANFLTFGNIRCHHELCGRDGVDALFPELFFGSYPFCGNADTLQVMFLDELRAQMPTAKIVVVRRDPQEVIESMHAKGFTRSEIPIRRLMPHIDQASQIPDALSVEFDDLGEEETMRAIQEHVAPGEPFDRERHDLLQSMNVQLTETSLNEIKRLAGIL